MALLNRSAIVFIWLISISPLALSSELVGLWQQYDDHTGNPEALIRIEKLPDNTYEGRIERILPDVVENSSMVCTLCTGGLHNRPLVGLLILSGMKRKDNLNFEEGEVLDPDDGKSYRCHIRMSEDGNSIQVTGYIHYNWIGQSEIWRRAN